jgi:glutamine synthetase
VCFTDLEGRLHMLDYDKKFLLKLGRQPDVRRLVDPRVLAAARVGPAPGDRLAGVLLAAVRRVRPGQGAGVRRGAAPGRRAVPADLRARLKQYTENLLHKDGTTAQFGHEIEGFLFKGRDAERRYRRDRQVRVHLDRRLLPLAAGRPAAQVHRHRGGGPARDGLRNEKDHPEVAPSQFEMNYSYTEALIAADQVQLYKLLCRQVAKNMDMTASFLPKPVTGINGNGMHTNMSIGKREEPVLGPGRRGRRVRSGWAFIERILYSAPDICLILNPSVNAYRRLDPHFEAPNQIKASAIDRGSMVRIPLGNERSARIEVRSVAPDANPYMVIYTSCCAGLEGPQDRRRGRQTSAVRTRFLPDNIHDAIRLFKGSKFSRRLLKARTSTRSSPNRGCGSSRRPNAARCSALGVCRRVKSVRDPVPPRGDQPVPVEPVLTRRPACVQPDAQRAA